MINAVAKLYQPNGRQQNRGDREAESQQFRPKYAV
jgi:hypothetical protein